MAIRGAHPDDLPRLLDIYNLYVVHTHITFDTEIVPIETRRIWFESFGNEGPHRLLVCESKGHIKGYASSTRFRDKPAYARSVETSIYLDPNDCGSGLGSELYGALLQELEEEEFAHRAYGGVALPNEASIALHQRLHFKRVATYSEVGFKFGRYWDVAWFERVL